MNKNEYGNYIRINLSTSLSGYNMSLILRSPSPYVKEFILLEEDGVSVGTAELTVDSEIFLPGEYVEYKVKEGDIFLSGEWTLRVAAESKSGKELRYTDHIGFYVKP